MGSIPSRLTIFKRFAVDTLREKRRDKTGVLKTLALSGGYGHTLSGQEEQFEMSTSFLDKGWGKSGDRLVHR